MNEGASGGRSRAMWPDFPIPDTITRPLAFNKRTTASPKLGPSDVLNVVSAAASASMTRFAEATNLTWSVMCAKKYPVRASQLNQVWLAWVKNQSKIAQCPYGLRAAKAR